MNGCIDLVDWVWSIYNDQVTWLIRTFKWCSILNITYLSWSIGLVFWKFKLKSVIQDLGIFPKFQDSIFLDCGRVPLPNLGSISAVAMYHFPVLEIFPVHIQRNTETYWFCPGVLRSNVPASESNGSLPVSETVPYFWSTSMKYSSSRSSFNLLLLSSVILPLLLIARLEFGADRPLTQAQLVLSCLANISSLATTLSKDDSAD